MSAWTVISHVDVPSGGQATISFNTISQQYDDLCIQISDRSNRSSAVNDAVIIQCNSQSVSGRRVVGSGSSVFTDATHAAINVASSATANVFSNMSFYISNYSSSTATKIISIDAVGENSASLAYQTISTALFNSNSPITSIVLAQETGTSFVQYSSATLYGITKGSSGGVTVS